MAFYHKPVMIATPAMERAKTLSWLQVFSDPTLCFLLSLFRPKMHSLAQILDNFETSRSFILTADLHDCVSMKNLAMVAVAMSHKVDLSN